MSDVMRRRTALAAATKCSRLTWAALTSSFIAINAASWQIEATSAPEQPSVYKG